MELRNGQEVKLCYKGSAKVIRELGRGGQGIVYLVEVDGKQMALKWYLRPVEDSFYRNLGENVQSYKESPEDNLYKSFLWPKYLTERDFEGYCGYVMDLRPQGYFEMSSILCANHKFKSVDALLAASMQICYSFQNLHRKGYSYQDLNDGNFFINTDTGDLAICDNDNVMPDGYESGIKGKSQYMAPEIVTGKGKPNRYSDLFSLSVILFLLLFGDHPLKGVRDAAMPCLTEDHERLIFGIDPIFIMDPSNDKNRPVKGIHRNVIRRWPLFPKVLKNRFEKEFSKDTMEYPKLRCLETVWIETLTKVRDSLVKCPYCGKETFVESISSLNKCAECGKNVKILSKILIKDRILPLTPGTEHYIDKDNIPDIKVYFNPKTPEMLALQNLGDKMWNVETPSGKVVCVNPKAFMPAKPGCKIRFTSELQGEITE